MFILFKPGERAISRPFQTKRPVSVPGRVTSPRARRGPETVLFRPLLFRLPGCVRAQFDPDVTLRVWHDAGNPVQVPGAARS